MQGDMIEARYSARFRNGWILFWSVWIIISIAITIFGLRFLGLFMIIVFGGLLILTLQRLANPAPVISIGPGSFHDRRLGAPIPWDAIQGLHRQISGSRIFLQIAVEQPQLYLGNAGLLKGPMLRINPRLGFPALASNLSGLDQPQERLASAAEAFAAHARR
jgi:hypothetical protein